MLTVKATLGQSKIHGFGLIARERIAKGATTWRFDPKFDILFDPAYVARMSEAQQQLVKTYAFLSQKSGKYVYSIDDTRFTNHSQRHANIVASDVPGEPEMPGIALRDIEIGEEILVDYRTFDAHDAVSGEEYLKH